MSEEKRGGKGLGLLLLAGVGYLIYYLVNKDNDDDQPAQPDTGAGGDATDGGGHTPAPTPSPIKWPKSERTCWYWFERRSPADMGHPGAMAMSMHANSTTAKGGMQIVGAWPPAEKESQILTGSMLRQWLGQCRDRGCRTAVLDLEGYALLRGVGLVDEWRRECNAHGLKFGITTKPTGDVVYRHPSWRANSTTTQESFWQMIGNYCDYWFPFQYAWTYAQWAKYLQEIAPHIGNAKTIPLVDAVQRTTAGEATRPLRADEVRSLHAVGFGVALFTSSIPEQVKTSPAATEARRLYR